MRPFRKNTIIPYDFLRFRIIGLGVHFYLISRKCYFPAIEATNSPGGLEAMLQNHAFSIGNIVFSENVPKSSSGAGLRNRPETYGIIHVFGMQCFCPWIAFL